jgi:hypothetical protein
MIATGLLLGWIAIGAGLAHGRSAEIAEDAFASPDPDPAESALVLIKWVLSWPAWGFKSS